MARRRDATTRGGPGRIVKNLAGSLARGYSYCRRSLSALVKRWTSAAILAALRIGRIVKAAWGGLGKSLKSLGRAGSGGYLYYRHPLPVRIMHWSNAVFLAVLLMSGLNIFEAHPALNWGKSSYDGVSPVLEIRDREDDKGGIAGVTRIFGRDFDTTGFLGVSRNEEGDPTARAFPSWLTIPDARWLAMARRWHFFFAWLLVINGVSFVTYSAVSRHLYHDLVPTRQDLRSTGGTIIDHMRFRHPSGEAARRYNVLQKSAYLSVIFFLLPLMVLMGLGMSPALDALRPGWVDIFLGRQSVRTIHFVVAGVLLLFVFVHVFEVIVSGFWNNLRSMITGYFRVKPEANHGK